MPHTPGPWYRKSHFIVDEQARIIADVRQCASLTACGATALTPRSQAILFPEAMANLILLSQAPALVAALERICAQMVGIMALADVPKSIEGIFDRILLQADEALTAAKAELVKPVSAKEG